MSEFQEGTFDFTQVAQEEGLNFDAIFGGGGVSSAPSAPAPAPAPTLAPATAVTAAPATTPSAQPQTQMPAAETPPKKAAPAAPPAVEAAAGDNLIAAAFEQNEAQETQAAAKSLFEKAPIFSYGSTKEEIVDPGMTFEDLRIAKSEDFPELGEGKRVTWTVEYGKETKTIPDPKGTTIRSIKESIERSKSFLDGLKKAKEKNPDCLVKPRVTAQSKGILASYKGTFSSLDEARESDKTICLIPAKDGKVYELRKTELGEFIAPKDSVLEFAALRAGFTPALPQIPLELMHQIISFFRYYMRESGELEALVNIYWDKEEERFIAHVPAQEVSKARVDTDLTQDALPEERYLHYADCHSHNSMRAIFSERDNSDERATRIYIVLGRLHQFFPEISVRMSCGGTFQELDPATVIESLGAVYPREWRDKVTPACLPASPAMDIGEPDTVPPPGLASGRFFFRKGDMK